jgi:putative transposase
MFAAVEHRFELVDRIPQVIEWLTDYGSCYIAGNTKAFSRDVGLESRTMPVRSP